MSDRRPSARGWAPRHWYQDVPIPLSAKLLSGVYAAVTGLRRWLYRKGLKRARHPGVPVIVVGNLVAGGAGKTPLTIAIVERLKAEGFNPGVASRGHGRADARTARWVDAGTPVEEAGDEPALIVAHTGVRLRVDRDRYRAAKALAADGCDVVVCDDGLQHYRLARDIEVEVIDGQRRYGNGRLMPAGPLREPVARGQRCDFRVVNLPDGAGEGARSGFGEWPMHLLADRAIPLLGGRACPLEAFSGHRVHAVAGIGNPERFFAMLRGRGLAVVPHAFPDHHAYRPSDLEFGSPLPVLMTEKDAVKCAGLHADQHYSVPVRARLPEAFWVALLERLAAPDMRRT